MTEHSLGQPTLNEELPTGEWIKYGFKASSFVPVIIGVAIVAIIFSGISGIRHGLISALGTFLFWAVISASILSILAIVFKRTNRVAINLITNHIRLGKEIFSFEQVDYLDMRIASSPLGYQVNFKISAGKVKSSITLALPLQKRIFSSEEYQALAAATQKFHIPATYQESGHLEKQNTVFVLGKAEASDILKVYASSH